MRALGNIIWLIFGGLFLAAGYIVAGLIACVFIVTIPFAVASFRMASFALWPFGRALVPKPGAGGGSTIANILWALFAGIWLALGHLFAALLCAITIIGIPFAIVHVKLAGVCFAPFGKRIVSAREAAGVRGAVVIGQR